MAAITIKIKRNDITTTKKLDANGKVIVETITEE